MTDPENVVRFPNVIGELIPNPWANDPQHDQPDVSVGLRANRQALAKLAADLDPEWDTPLARLARAMS